MHGETLQTSTPAAGRQIDDLILLWHRNGSEGNKELCYLSKAKEYFLVSLSLTRQALSRPFLAAMRKVDGVLLGFSL